MHVVEEGASTLCVHEFTVSILACSYRITCFIFFNFRRSQMQMQINLQYARYALILLSFKVHGISNKKRPILKPEIRFLVSLLSYKWPPRLEVIEPCSIRVINWHQYLKRHVEKRIKVSVKYRAFIKMLLCRPINISVRNVLLCHQFFPFEVWEKFRRWFWQWTRACRSCYWVDPWWRHRRHICWLKLYRSSCTRQIHILESCSFLWNP